MTSMLRSLISAFLTDTYTVRRMATAGTYVDGHYVAGRGREFPVKGSLQPLSAREVLQLPEGERVRAAFKLYTDTLLQTSRESGERQADTVVVRGESYKVMSIERWDGTRIPYFKAVLARVQLEQEVRGER